MTGVDELGEGGSLLILGMARSGAAAALAARRVLPQMEVIVTDRDPDPKAADAVSGLAGAGVRMELGVEDITLLDGCALVIKSPGVPQENPLLLEAKLRGIPVWGEVEFASRFLDNIIVGVTGTNGKTTTTELLGHVLAEAGMPCRVAGNVGIALSSMVGEAGSGEVLVVELSSFQLEDIIAFRPDIAILLNLAEDHLDRHPDLENYFAAKMRIFENQHPEDVSIINLDDPDCRRTVPGHASRAWFSRSAGDARPEAGETEEPLVFVRASTIRANLRGLEVASAGLRQRLSGDRGRRGDAEGGNAAASYAQGRNAAGGGEVTGEGGSTAIVDWSEVGLKGEHNLDNCLAATAAGLCLGLSPEAVAAGLKSFPGVPHRLQEVREVDGVMYVNDSKATNVDATLMALTAYRHGIHLILGGRGKGCDFDDLAVAASGANVSEVILIGEAANDIAASFDMIGTEVIMAGGLEQAVALARENAESGDVIMLSPACASFDQYDNYEQRGEHFVDIVNQIETQGD